MPAAASSGIRARSSGTLTVISISRGSRPAARAESMQGGKQLGRRAAGGEEALREAAGAAGRGLGMAADHDRHRAGGGLGAHVGAGEAHELAGVTGRVLFPQGAHGADVLLGAPAALGEGDAERIEFFPQPADADAEDHPAAGEVVQGGDLLGAQHRVVFRQDQDAGGEFDPRGGGGDIGHPDQRVGDAEGTLAPGHAAVLGVGVGGAVVVRDDHVFHGPGGFEAGGFGRLEQGDGLARVGVAAGVAVAQAEFHPGVSLRV